MKETQFRSSTLRAVESSVDVESERENSNRKKMQVLTEILVIESVTAYLDSGCNFIKFIYGNLVSSSFWKSDLVKGPVSFNYRVFRELPKRQTALCYRLFVQWCQCPRMGGKRNENCSCQRICGFG